ncbi:MAG TPA: PQQ-binding-like beta-propeller repeat protein [Candidatus Polarisedimenticolia bacterium]|nr:PQQ-binding-like beta-propeller repeat protein [Candidatus Polarisedimenticolia bacterium]
MQRSSKGVLVAAAAAAVVSAALAAQPSPGADWPRFRGGRGDGVSDDAGLLKEWPAQGPRQVWRRPIGEGFSGVAVSGGRLYTMDSGDHQGTPFEFASALDPDTGREIWRTPVGPKHDTQFGNGPRATPTVAGDAVYVLGSRGTLKALSAADGAARWSLDLTEAFGSKVPTWGFSGSVVAEDGKVLLEGGGPQGKSFAAVDAQTGKVLWTFGDGPPEPGYGTPLAVDIAGRRQYVHVVGTRLFALDASGKEVWSHAWPEGETHAMPVFVPPDRIFESGAEGVGGVLLQIENGPDRTTVKEVWKNGTFRTHFNAAILHQGHLYGFDNTSLKCIKAEDGGLAWVKRGLGKGSLILADGMLVVLADDGRLVLAEATPSGFVEKGMVQALQGRCWTPPAMAGGRVYLRNHSEIVAYDLKG